VDPEGAQVFEQTGAQPNWLEYFSR
jgi:hypothetical protein